MYRLGFNASSFSHRVLTGTWRRRATRCPSYRHGRAVPEAASGGTGAKSVARHREVPILFLPDPLYPKKCRRRFSASAYFTC